ncbi:MAG: hypothetical protein FWG49_04905, partial [Leptospirales bacterium]|nr:hypothetical protein [Leptospirales bacterium]
MVIAMLKTCRYKIGIIFSILLLLTTLSCSKEQQAQKTPDMRFLLVQGDVIVTSASGDTKNAATGELSEIKCDTVLLAMGMKERWKLVDELRHSAPESNVHIVGDCRNVGTIAEAVNQAF